MSLVNNYKVLDLFSGAGGMSEGFLQTGFKITNACDYSQEAALTYKNRHIQLGYETIFYQGDIKNLTKPKKLKAGVFSAIVLCNCCSCSGVSRGGRPGDCCGSKPAKPLAI